MDECTIPYGRGQHVEVGRAKQGTQVRTSKDYRMSNATWIGTIDEVEMLKSNLTATAAKGSGSFNFFCREEPRKLHAPELFDPAVTTVIAENGRCMYMLFDMLGRSGRANHPTAQHFHPEI